MPFEAVQYLCLDDFGNLMEKRIPIEFSPSKVLEGKGRQPARCTQIRADGSSLVRGEAKAHADGLLNRVGKKSFDTLPRDAQLGQ